MKQIWIDPRIWTYTKAFLGGAVVAVAAIMCAGHWPRPDNYPQIIGAGLTSALYLHKEKPQSTS